MQARLIPPALLMTCALGACLPAADPPAPIATVPATQTTPVEALRRSATVPEGGGQTCWARDDAPADVARDPAPGGEVATWFRIPCEAESDAMFIASLQRALSARGAYSGAATGRLDEGTRTAIIGYQRSLGLRSGVLSLAAARTLGLVVWEPGASLWD